MDFLSHLIDAPLANILIVAGLFFLGIGAVGKVVGKIEPDKFGRVIAGLLGVVLIAAGIVIHVQGDKSKNTSIRPVIRAFTVSPLEIKKGGKVTIHWEVSDADEVRLEPFGQVSVTGDKVVELEKTTTYTLEATNKSGGKNGTFQEVLVTNKVVNPITKPPVKPASDVERLTSTTKPASDTAKAPTQDAEAVYASQPPPPLPDYDQPPDVRGNSAWIPGSWYYDAVQVDYYWVPGAWVTPPDSLAWTPPYWEYESVGRYRWHSGYWATHVGFYGGIDYGFGYTGSGYHRSAVRSSNPSSCNGGPNRPRKKPTEDELARQDRHTLATPEQAQLERNSKTPRQFYKVTQGQPHLLKLPGPLVAASGGNDISGGNTPGKDNGHGNPGPVRGPCVQGFPRPGMGNPCSTQIQHKDGRGSGSGRPSGKESPSTSQTPHRSGSPPPSQPKAQTAQSKPPQTQKH